jgi:lysophospholipase L1-like esterase
MRYSAAGCLLVLFLAGAPGAMAADRCAAPKELRHLSKQLSRLAAKLASGTGGTIVALGSSSTAGWGASDPAHSYPSELATALKALLPEPGITVLNRGIGGEDVPQQYARLDDDVLSAAPDLVIWQLGTNALLQNTDDDAWEAMLRDGIRRLRRAGSDVVLMDLQYADAVLQNSRHRGMVDRIARIAEEEGAGVFHRYQLMLHWVRSGQFDHRSLNDPDGLHMNDASYYCLGRQMALALAEGMAAAPPPARVASGRRP